MGVVPSASNKPKVNSFSGPSNVFLMVSSTGVGFDLPSSPINTKPLVARPPPWVYLALLPLMVTAAFFVGMGLGAAVRDSRVPALTTSLFVSLIVVLTLPVQA